MIRRIALLVLGLALAASAAAADKPGEQSVWFGGDVDISQSVDGPVFAAGGKVTLNAPIAGSAHLAGGTVTIASDGSVAGNVHMAAGTIDVEGPINGDLRAAGGEVRINGQVTGDASIAAGTLELGPRARIEGKLTYHGRELRRDPAAQVLGGVENSPGRVRHHDLTSADDFRHRWTHGWVWTAGLMLLAALIAGALPGATSRMAQELRERPWIATLLGLVAITAIPVAAVLLVVTIIGIPVALLALVGYVALLLVGYVWLAVVVGGMLLDRVSPETAAVTAWRVGAAMLAMLALAALARVPFLGGLVHFVALIVGVGMVVAALFRHTHPTAAAATQTA